ncbi:MAG: YfiR family protein [Rhizobacter sp.]|nr:YfiR family protein [Rhizobacter sp.]
MTRHRARLFISRSGRAGLWGLLALAAALLCAGPAAADPPHPSADEAKAAYVLKFAGFVDWPVGAFTSPDAPLVVGVAGGGPLQDELHKLLAGRVAQGRALQVRELHDMREAAAVHILVIARAAWRRAGDWVSATRGHPVLVITDMSRGLERGAALCIVESPAASASASASSSPASLPASLATARIGFEASIPAAEQAGLRISSRLLAVADRVLKATP